MTTFDPQEGTLTLDDLRVVFAEALESFPTTPGLEVIRLGDLFSEWAEIATVTGGVIVER